MLDMAELEYPPPPPPPPPHITDGNIYNAWLKLCSTLCIFLYFFSFVVL